jgi:hypothetical protein
MDCAQDPNDDLLLLLLFLMSLLFKGKAVAYHVHVLLGSVCACIKSGWMIR